VSRADYIADPDVRQFVAWLAASLDGPAFAHAYYDRRHRANWQCGSLPDAATSYRWSFRVTLPTGEMRNGRTLYANGETLMLLSDGLRAAVVDGDDDRCVTWGAAVLKWGGVTRHNASWLERNRCGLAEHLGGVSALLSDPNIDENALQAVDRFNAGMTKIYSVLADDVLIYDSRVAAALGWLIRQHCESRELDAVPAPLRFPWMGGRGDAGRRDPGVGTLRFPRRRSDARHACANLQASWLLEEVLDTNPHTAFSGPDFQDAATPLRALEAALFMVGYNVHAERPAYLVAA